MQLFDNTAFTDFAVAGKQLSLSPEQVLFDKIAESIANVLSALGCILNIIMIIKLRLYRLAIGRMALQFFIVNFLYDASCLIGMIKLSSELFCEIQSFLQFIGLGASLAWACCFGHALLVMIQCHDIKAVSQKVTIYSRFAIITGLLLAIISLLTHYSSLDPVTKTCWHQIPEHGLNYGDSLTMILPAMISIIYCFYCHIKAIRRISKSTKRMIWGLLSFPTVLIISYLPYAIDVVWCVVTKKEPAFVIIVIVNVLFNSQGLLNALAYGLSRDMLKKFQKKPLSSEDAEKEGREWRVSDAFHSDSENSSFSESSLTSGVEKNPKFSNEHTIV